MLQYTQYMKDIVAEKNPCYMNLIQFTRKRIKGQ